MSNKELKAYSKKLHAQAEWMTAAAKFFSGVALLIGALAGFIKVLI